MWHLGDMHAQLQRLACGLKQHLLAPPPAEASSRTIRYLRRLGRTGFLYGWRMKEVPLLSCLGALTAPIGVGLQLTLSATFSTSMPDILAIHFTSDECYAISGPGLVVCPRAAWFFCLCEICDD